MKKEELMNLVKYHVENNNEAFRTEVIKIATEFDAQGDEQLAKYLMNLISDTNFFVPQIMNDHYQYLSEVSYPQHPLYLPDLIKDDILGIKRAIENNSGLSKFLFYGAPGTGKTESAYQIARLLKRKLLTVDFTMLIDSRLGQTAKNVSALFDEVERLPYDHVVVLFDEIDALILDRVHANDLREMGRVTSTFLKKLDQLNSHYMIIATTNLFTYLDKALTRRFDVHVNFDRYSQEDLIEIGDLFLKYYVKKIDGVKLNTRTFHKIMSLNKERVYPGDLKRIIKTAVAFSDGDHPYDYLRRIYLELSGVSQVDDLKQLSEDGFTVREIELLTQIPKSSVARKLKEVVNE